MIPPIHATVAVGDALAHDYFSPGHTTTHFSKWAVAFWKGRSFRFERTAVGAPWVRVEEKEP